MPTLLRMISGARYSGVPHSVQVLPFTRLANPKSVTWETEKVEGKRLVVKETASFKSAAGQWMMGKLNYCMQPCR